MKPLIRMPHSQVRARRRPKAFRRWFVPLVEPLERRVLLATFHVDSTLDLRDDNLGDGIARAIDPVTGLSVTTLRAAVNEANALAGPDVIILPAGAYRLEQLTPRTNTLAITSDLVIRADIA